MRTNQTKTPAAISTIGIDLGKTTFHLIGLDKRGAIVLRQKVSRGQLERRLANVPRCLIGMESARVPTTSADSWRVWAMTCA
jgi:transposase